MPYAARPLIERFLPKIEFTDSCWIWVGHIQPNGYAKFNGGPGQSPKFGHRFSYEWFVGPIPKGMTIDHLCRVRHCVNPDHLEAVTPIENYRRGLMGDQRGLPRPKPNHCPHGHHYSDENTYVDRRGARNCRACRRERQHLKYWEARSGITRIG